MEENKSKARKKTQINYIQAHSIRDLLNIINSYNIQNPDTPILKEDIVEIIREEGTFILLYYK